MRIVNEMEGKKRDLSNVVGFGRKDIAPSLSKNAREAASQRSLTNAYKDHLRCIG